MAISSKGTAQRPGLCERFTPRDVFGTFGYGAFVPETIAASKELSPTAKLCYGHLLRRAGKNDRCWPSYRDIADAIGMGERQAMRSVGELVNAQLIHPLKRAVESGRQTSNGYEFLWGPILAGEGDRSDTLPADKSVRATLSNMSPSGVSEMSPLEVSNINHQKGSKKEGSIAPVFSMADGSSQPRVESASSDGDSQPAMYASGKDELKAIFRHHTGDDLKIRDLDAIEVSLSLSGVTWEAFVEDVRAHSWGRITNPVGFLRDRAKKFRALTRRSAPSLTAAEGRTKGYRCAICGSAIPGEGARLLNGKGVPCECATPEYIERIRRRGVFGKEEAD